MATFLLIVCSLAADDVGKEKETAGMVCRRQGRSVKWKMPRASRVSLTILGSRFLRYYFRHPNFYFLPFLFFHLSVSLSFFKLDPAGSEDPCQLTCRMLRSEIEEGRWCAARVLHARHALAAGRHQQNGKNPSPSRSCPVKLQTETTPLCNIFLATTGKLRSTYRNVRLSGALA